jgi:hypothetical protein
MQEAIGILEHSEVVLMKKIKGMKDGKPKYAASERLREIRQAILVLKQFDEAFPVISEADEDAILAEQFMHNPPHAKA